MTPTRRRAPKTASRSVPRHDRPASRLIVAVVRPPGVRAAGLARWLESVAPARARGTITIAVLPDGRVRELNRRYRRKNAPTDVLSFPAGEPGELGDVVIALGVAKRQAAAAGHSLGTELKILALHGLLHLLGYDHEHDDGEMRRLEQRLRVQGGLRAGLIEREMSGARSAR